VGTLDAGSTSTDAAALWAAASQRRPSIVALRKQQEAARSGLLLARRERLVVPVASGGLLKTQDVAGNSFLFGLSVPLPLFDRNQGAIAKATAQMTAADLDLQASLAEAQAEVQSAADNLAKRRAALSAFETSVGQRAASLQQMAEDAYREGSADILELLDANRSLREIQLTRVEQREAVKLAEEQVISAAALDIAEDGTVR
jgi:cobalt-zinc-cadmium efflux system outer membrane protein